MDNIALYLMALVKYIFIGILIGGILMYFFPIVGLVVLILLLLGSFSAARNDGIVKESEFSDEEFSGFNEGLRLTSRKMK